MTSFGRCIYIYRAALTVTELVFCDQIINEVQISGRGRVVYDMFSQLEPVI